MQSLLLVIGLLAFVPSLAAPAMDEAIVHSLITIVCRNEPLDETKSLFHPDASIAEEHLERRGHRFGWRRSIKLADGRSIRLDRIAPNNQFRGGRLERRIKSKPELFIAVGADCIPHTARRLKYGDSGKAIELLHLNSQLTPIRTELLDPPLPPVYGASGVRIGMVDSGINYTLELFGPHLVRDIQGDLVGYDYWDLDPLPFDSNPARSPFFPQRHGTRTASLLIKEAPKSVLVPYRYPRPDMGRMREVVQHAAAHGVSILGMPLGSHNRHDWLVFAEAARAHPDLLFIVSAGNQGKDIDRSPVYPASLPLANMLVVTSADDYGRPAEGSNWGPASVDLLVPAERIAVTDFEGRPIVVSGSSYAVSRVTALAARFKSMHPGWSSHELMSAIYAMAVRTVDQSEVKVGLLTDPQADTALVTRVLTRRLELEPIENEKKPTHRVALHIVLLKGSTWTENAAGKTIGGAAKILAQCGLELHGPELHVIDASEYLLDFAAGTARTLVERVAVPTPTVYLVRDSKMEFPFDGEAFGRANSTSRPWLTDSVWLVEDTADPDIALAHELFHVLANQGDHSDQPGNLMQEHTGEKNHALSPEQCQQALHTSVAHGLTRLKNR
ncbi:MAG: S8/S53 family peptidase [Gammaproteobacteria bacterium]|nr:S8/S53 family peptidase [Gammaproteobacteria bacterium]